MKHIYTTLLLILFSFPSFSQNPIIRDYKDDCQRGHHILVNGDWKPHGTWKHHYGKARYNKGQLVWIKLNGKERVYYETIRLTQLQNKIESLETKLAERE